MANTSCFENVPWEINQHISKKSLNNLKRFLESTSIPNLNFPNDSSTHGFHFFYSNRKDLIFVNKSGQQFNHTLKVIREKHYSTYFAICINGPNIGNIYVKFPNNT